ncbi:MAG: dipeptidase [Acutalibacteraceae bacterium]
MNFFDLHCDTIGECCNNNLPLRKNSLDVDLERATLIGNHVQIFAIWFPDELRGVDAVEYFNKTADYFYSEIEKNEDLISLYRENKKTPVKAILAVEGGSACGGTTKGLEHLYSRGVRLITLTWNGKNEIASGAFSEGGITDFGKEFIRAAENIGIILDVSHLNRQSFSEFVNISKKPFIASHSNADIVNNDFGRKRNLSDEQIRIIKERKGLIGLNFCEDFLEDERARGVDALCRQIDYMLSLDCADVIAFGSDFDGCAVHRDFKGIQKIPEVYSKLKARGYNETLLNKFFYKNAENFFSKIKAVS